MITPIDLRGRMSPVGDQGMRPTCVAFALSACHEFVNELVSKELSKDSIHWGCVFRDGSAIHGVSITTAMRVLVDEGQHLEEDWPYRADLDEITWESLQPPKLDGKPVFTIEKGISIKISNPNAIGDVLRVTGPLCAIVPIWESFFVPQKGHMSMPKTDIEEFRGLHAVCVVGLTSDGNVVIRNSWGPRWGNCGHAIMPFKYLQKYVSNVYILVPLGEK